MLSGARHFREATALGYAGYAVGACVECIALALVATVRAVGERARERPARPTEDVSIEPVHQLFFGFSQNPHSLLGLEVADPSLDDRASADASRLRQGKEKRLQFGGEGAGGDNGREMGKNAAQRNQGYQWIATGAGQDGLHGGMQRRVDVSRLVDDAVCNGYECGKR